MNLLPIIQQKVNNFLFEPSSSSALGFFRIAVAVLCIIQMFSIYPDILNIYGEYGFIRRELSDLLLFKYAPRVNWFSDLLYFYDINETISLNILFFSYIFLLFLFMFGVFTRYTAIVVWFIHLMFLGSNQLFTYGFDYFIAACLFYCIIMPVGFYYSIDNIIKKRLYKPSIYTTFYLRVLQLNLCLVYFFGGGDKMLGTQWWDGEAIWRALMMPYFYQFDMSWIASLPWLAIILSWSTILLEFTYCFFIWHHRTRPIWLLGILGMHIGIGIFMGLYFFAAIMIIMNITAFGWDYIEQLATKFTIIKFNKVVPHTQAIVQPSKL